MRQCCTFCDIVLGNYYLSLISQPASIRLKLTVLFTKRNGLRQWRDSLAKPQSASLRKVNVKQLLGHVFNEILPEDFHTITTFVLRNSLRRCWRKFNKYGAEETAKIADRMKGQASVCYGCGRVDWYDRLRHFEEIPSVRLKVTLRRLDF